MVEVFIERTNQKIELDFEGQAIELVKKLGLNPEEVIVTVNNEVVSDEEKIKEGDKVKIISVISGG